MAVNRYDSTTGRPIFEDTDAPDIKVDPGAAALYAEDVGNRIVRANLAGLNAYPYARKGMSGYALDTGLDYLHNGSGWVPTGGRRQGAISIASGFTDSGGSYLVADGDLVTLRIAVDGSLPNGTYTQVATIPAEFRPLNPVSGGGVGSSGHPLGFQVTSAGVVQFSHFSGSARAWGSATISYYLGV